MGATQSVGMRIPDLVGMRTPGSAAVTPRLVKAAHEFEGQMMKELLKPMTSEAGSDDGDSASAGGALGEFAAEALGQGLSERGGFGVADRIVRELSHSGTTHASGRQDGNQTVEKTTKVCRGLKI